MSTKGSSTVVEHNFKETLKLNVIYLIGIGILAINRLWNFMWFELGALFISFLLWLIFASSCCRSSKTTFYKFYLGLTLVFGLLSFIAMLLAVIKIEWISFLYSFCETHPHIKEHFEGSKSSPSESPSPTSEADNQVSEALWSFK